MYVSTSRNFVIVKRKLCVNRSIVFIVFAWFLWLGHFSRKLSRILTLFGVLFKRKSIFAFLLVLGLLLLFTVEVCWSVVFNISCLKPMSIVEFVFNKLTFENDEFIESSIKFLNNSFLLQATEVRIFAVTSNGRLTSAIDKV